MQSSTSVNQLCANVWFYGFNSVQVFFNSILQSKIWDCLFDLMLFLIVFKKGLNYLRELSTFRLRVGQCLLMAEHWLETKLLFHFWRISCKFDYGPACAQLRVAFSGFSARFPCFCFSICFVFFFFFFGFYPPPPPPLFLLFDVHIWNYTKTIVRLRVSKYSPIYTSPSANNCWILNNYPAKSRGISPDT